MRNLGPMEAVAGMMACYNKATFRRTANVVDIGKKGESIIFIMSLVSNVRQRLAHKETIFSVEFSACAAYLASVSQDSIVRIWQVREN